jgi:hypothetical protein
MLWKIEEKPEGMIAALAKIVQQSSVFCRNTSVTKEQSEALLRNRRRGALEYVVVEEPVRQ